MIEKLKAFMGLPFVKQVTWLLNSRKAIVTIVGILVIVFSDKLGMDYVQSEQLSWQIVALASILVGATAYEDAKKNKDGEK